MEKIKNFPFNDLVLYAKCWYERTDNIFDDVKKCIEHDNKYSTWDKMSQRDICRLMLICLEKLYSYLDENDKKNNCWLCSHAAFLDALEHHMKFYGQTYEEAIVSIVLGILGTLSVDQIEIKKPVYKRGERRMGDMFKKSVSKSMTYKEMNRIASKMFDKKK